LTTGEPMTFDEESADEIIRPEKLAQYRHELAHYHTRLSKLHHHLYFMEKIATFPFYLFTNPAEDQFLSITYESYGLLAILEIVKLARDSGGKRTLNRLTSFMMKAIRSEYLHAYKDRMRNADFTKKINKLLDHAQSIRTNVIAHSLPLTSDIAPLWLSDTNEMMGEITKLFETASFSTTYHYLGLAYECEKAPSDIDRILNGIARDSPIIDMPEENTAAWEGSRKFRTEKWLADFNRYRQRLGVPDA
jgi:hypothetical protein